MVSPRPFSHRLFSLLLALLVLAASVGLTVLRHTCRESGHTTADIIFTAPKHGCPPPKPTANSHSSQIKGACCDFSAHLHKLEVPSPELTWAKLLPSPLLAPVWLPTSCWPTAPAAPLVAQAATWHAADSSPPPRAGRVLLSFISVLVV